MVIYKTGTPVTVESLPEDEAAVLMFLKENSGTQFTTEEVGRAVRPLVMKNVKADKLCREGRIVGNWAGKRLNSLYRKNLIKKEGTKGRSEPMRWQA